MYKFSQLNQLIKTFIKNFFLVFLMCGLVAISNNCSSSKIEKIENKFSSGNNNTSNVSSSNNNLIQDTNINEKNGAYMVPEYNSSEKNRGGHETYANKYLIASQNAYASEVGIKIFKKGGNIFDAAVAISFVLAVTRPQSTGLGGGGFMLYYTPKMKEPMALDFREKAPILATEDMFVSKNGKTLKSKSLDTIFAVAIPGMVAGLMEIHKKHGRLSREVVLAPAIKIAEEGFDVYEHLALSIEKRQEILKLYESSREIFFKSNATGEQQPLRVGDKFIQKDLAKTLRAISKNGRDGFYKGWVAKAIVDQSRVLEGLITKKDLDLYEVKYRRAVSGTFKNYKVYSMSPPSSGGTHIIQMLNMLEADDLRAMGIHSATAINLMASSMQLVFADRAKYMGDSDFVKVPLEGLLSKKYALELRKKILKDKALLQDNVVPGEPSLFEKESAETNHFTIMDKDGNVITTTQTVNGPLGSGVIVKGTGVLLNNEMNDFTAKLGGSNLFGAIGGANNMIAAQKRPLSSMSPTIVFKDKRPIFALGTAAGTRILTCVAQTILNYLEFGLPLYEAVAAVRFHQQWYPDELRIDGPYLPVDTIESLKSMGHKINYEDLDCRIQAVAKENRGREGGREGRESILHGVSDPRSEGLALGE
ncbi:MAG: gamma-glutamyltransferase [Oligoflexia bacterium]|nr:gamma-glutamyltransferase [Oligoflexia bacterium]